MADEDRHFTHSTLRERIVEHLFVGDVLRTLWKQGVTDVEILRPEFDAHGYDVVMSRGPVVRPVQLKTQAAGKVSVGRALAEKPSGCVVWIGLEQRNVGLGTFSVVWWFGGLPGLPCPTSLLIRTLDVRRTMLRVYGQFQETITSRPQQHS